MIVTEVYAIRDDGVKLYRTCSDSGMMIQKDGTEEIYAEAVDVENSGFAYVETDIPIDDGDETSDVEQKAEAFDFLTGRGDSDE